MGFQRTKMPDAKRLMEMLEEVDKNPWLCVNLYPRLIQAIAGQSLLPDELVRALGQTAGEVMEQSHIKHPPAIALLVSPFTEQLHLYAIKLLPEGSELNRALRILALAKYDANRSTQ